jgi:hypothetical protein
MAAINGKSRCRMTGPRTGKRCRRWLLLKVTPYCKVSAVYRFRMYVLYAYQNLNSNCNIFIFRILNPWFVCVYLWIFVSLRIFQRDPVWHSYFYDRGVTVEQLGTLPWCMVNYFETLRHRTVDISGGSGGGSFIIEIRVRICCDGGDDELRRQLQM